MNEKNCDLSYHIFKNNTVEFLFGGNKALITENSDFWRLHLDDGFEYEIPCYSSYQKDYEIFNDGNETVVKYNSLTTADGRKFNVVFKVHIISDETGIDMYSEIENNDDIRVSELQMPFIDMEKFYGDTEKEEMYIPIGLGIKEENIRKYVAENCHTEYMSADYNTVWFHNQYPQPLSMPWMALKSDEYLLYVSRQDKDFRLCNFSVGTSPRNTKSRIILSVSGYPAVCKGEKIKTANSHISVLRGEIEDAARLYRKWSEENWLEIRKKPVWVNEIDGWQRIILKHQYGEIFFTYDDLYNVYKSGAEYGIKALLVFGWWKGRFDNGYPLYEPDPALGGAEKMKEAIKKIQADGGRVYLYSNGTLIDIKSDFYAEHGDAVKKIDIDNNEYRDHYQFSNNGTLLRQYGYKSFAIACHATDEWKNKLMENCKVKLSFDPDSVFFDQLGCCFRPCFNKAHKHGGRIDDELRFRKENIEELKKLIPEGKAIGTEWQVDIFATSVDYVHGYGEGTWYCEDACPAMFRTAFPECIISNRLLHDDRSDYKEQLNYTFMNGLIFDISVYRGRKSILADLPELAEYVGRLTKYRAKYREYFINGKYEKGVFSKTELSFCKYTLEDKQLIIYWNNTDMSQKTKVDGVEYTIDCQDILCLEY